LDGRWHESVVSGPIGAGCNTGHGARDLWADPHPGPATVRRNLSPWGVPVVVLVDHLCASCSIAGRRKTDWCMVQQLQRRSNRPGCRAATQAPVKLNTLKARP
jgi:hypothetical protein